ncbi:MAG: hypothetical protein OEY29_15865 [Gammaproteobacteria bacterium]|nr:hypothetical protein [Gammaproteobacteria bacterium]
MKHRLITILMPFTLLLLTACSGDSSVEAPVDATEAPVNSTFGNATFDRSTWK